MQWLNKAKQVAGDAASQVKTKVEESQMRKRADEAAKEVHRLADPLAVLEGEVDHHE